MADFLFSFSVVVFSSAKVFVFVAVAVAVAVAVVALWELIGGQVEVLSGVMVGMNDSCTRRDVSVNYCVANVLQAVLLLQL